MNVAPCGRWGFSFPTFHSQSLIPSLQGLDWAALAARKVPAPFRPQIRSELDVGNFAEEFTRLEPVYSPPGSPPPGDPRIFQVSESSQNHRCHGDRILLPALAQADSAGLSISPVHWWVPGVVWCTDYHGRLCL